MLLGKQLSPISVSTRDQKTDHDGRPWLRVLRCYNHMVERSDHLSFPGNQRDRRGWWFQSPTIFAQTRIFHHFSKNPKSFFIRKLDGRIFDLWVALTHQLCWFWVGFEEKNPNHLRLVCTQKWIFSSTLLAWFGFGSTVFIFESQVLIPRHFS